MKKTFLLLSFLAFNACNQPEKLLHGYVEGEYLYIAPTTAGILHSISVKRGEKVSSGAELFSLDDTVLKANITSTEAEVTKMQAKLNNLLKGQRPEEIEVIKKGQAQAQANFDNAKKRYNRAKILILTGGVSRSIFESRETEYNSTKAKLEQLEAQLKVANLSARKDEIEAAQAELKIAQQHLLKVKREWVEAMPQAPVSSYVENTFYRNGEFVPAGRPVVSLLPPENIKVRFFVSQKQLPELSLGNKISVSCDGCDKEFIAKISFISSQAEYTPPVIYSIDSREKLVFLVEALPVNHNNSLRPGLPVDIHMEVS